MAASAQNPRTVVIGAGVAGLAAAAELARAGAPAALVLERASEPGGLLSTREDQGRRVDLGLACASFSDERTLSLVRDVGLEEAVRRIDDLTWTLESGMQTLAARVAARLEIRAGATVGAVDFPDPAGGPATVRLAGNREPIPASLVILAIPAPEVALVLGSNVEADDLRAIRELVAAAAYRVAFTGAFLMGVAGLARPRAIETFDPPEPIHSIVDQALLCPARMPANRTVLVVHAGPAFSQDLLTMKPDEAATALFNAARRLRPSMPLIPLHAVYRKWRTGFPESPPRDPPFVSLPSRRLILAGAWLGGSPTDGAVLSGTLAAQESLRLAAAH